MAQAYQQIRNEAIQMFCDLPNNQRDALYNAIVADPSTPVEVTNPDGLPPGVVGVDPYLGRAFVIFSTRPNTSPNWGELNSLLASLVINGMSNLRAAGLYYIFHDNLLAMGQVPAAPAPVPPPVPWFNAQTNQQIQAVAGFGPLAAAFQVPAPTPADALFPGAPPPLPAPIVPPAPVPIALPFMNVPHNTQNAITYADIAEGDEMVNFHGSRGFGRYYKKSTYDNLALPKRNPFTQQPIAAANLIRYRAHLVPAAQNANLGQQGGKKRKGRKRQSRRLRRKSRKTRKH